MTAKNPTPGKEDGQVPKETAGNQAPGTSVEATARALEAKYRDFFADLGKEGQAVGLDQLEDLVTESMRREGHDLRRTQTSLQPSDAASRDELSECDPASAWSFVTAHPGGSGPAG